MTVQQDKSFSEKHANDPKPDPEIKDEILKNAKEGEIPCAIAFEIAKRQKVSPAKVGKNVDLLELKLVKCQLGLFGYSPQKKIVKSSSEVSQDLKHGIQNALTEGKLSCERAWEIAKRFEVSKMQVSGACEAMGIKIKPCQLGAF
jgi:hypothetical protein